MDSICSRDIERFIRLFKGTEKIFTEGLCYWFAYILTSKFGGNIMYSPLNSHFVSSINERLWDATGDVTEKYVASPLIDWNYLMEIEPSWSKRIIDGCNI